MCKVAVLCGAVYASKANILDAPSRCRRQAASADARLPARAGTSHPRASGVPVIPSATPPRSCPGAQCRACGIYRINCCRENGGLSISGPATLDVSQKELKCIDTKLPAPNIFKVTPAFCRGLKTLADATVMIRTAPRNRPFLACKYRSW